MAHARSVSRDAGRTQTRRTRRRGICVRRVHAPGTRIDWGLAPSTTLGSEPSAAEKVARLNKFAASNGSLDGEKPQQLHFTAKGDLEAMLRAPVEPLPKRD